MDVRLSAEQRALRDSAVHLVGRRGATTVAALDDEARRAKLDAAVDDAGWRDLRTATDDGAPWASAVEVAIVAEELACGVADTPFLGPTLAADLRRRAGAAPASSRETVALTADLGSLAGPDAADGVAIDAAGSTSALVRVPSDEGHQPGTVDLQRPEVRADLTRAMATVAPHASPRPLGGALTDDDLTAWTALGLAVACADLVGSMRGALDLTTTYAAERRQYDRPVASFQAVQHLLADALVAMEGSRSATLHAAWAVDALAPADALAAAAVAKAWCARAARSVCETAIQVHGGIGNTWECLAHVHLRRSLLSTDVLGGTGPSLARVLEHHEIGAGDGVR
jgi:alkylation response protein AidB-like acyl-CoA dehydrogenase